MSLVVLVVCALLAAAVGGGLVVLTIAVLAATRSRARSGPGDHAGDHRTIT